MFCQVWPETLHEWPVNYPLMTTGNSQQVGSVSTPGIYKWKEWRIVPMWILRLFLIMGIMMILALLAGCGQQSSTGGGTNATPTPTHVPSPAVTRTPFPTATTGAVSLSVGATFYHTTDTISVTLSNQSTKTIYFPDHLTNCTVIQLQRQVHGSWENVNACPLQTPTRLHRLDAGKSLTVALVSSASRPWAVGLYHATLRYSTSQTFGGLATTIDSSGFQVVS